MLLTAVDLLVDDHAVKTFLWRLADELFGESNVLLASKAERINDALHLILGLLNALRNLHFLLTREQGHLAHLLEVHADGII